jgi:hypothetical protein
MPPAIGHKRVAVQFDHQLVFGFVKACFGRGEDLACPVRNFPFIDDLADGRDFFHARRLKGWLGINRFSPTLSGFATNYNVGREVREVREVPPVPRRPGMHANVNRTGVAAGLDDPGALNQHCDHEIESFEGPGLAPRHSRARFAGQRSGQEDRPYRRAPESSTGNA